MKDSNSTNSQSVAPSTPPRDMGFSPWQRLKTKRISYLALPLIVMATLAEFVILSIGWKYQKTVCLPPGMGVTFFGIGPIGATILMVELLKLPLAAWTASRHGWRKKFMLIMGLPLICILTFQLVKDMAVYEMGIALTPASQMLEKASTEEVKIAQLNGQLAGIEQKKKDRDNQLAELAARNAKAKADLEESLKRNGESRQDAISLTDYQQKELSEVQSRQATIIKQCDADAAQLNKALTDLRAQREVELPRATKWNAEEARIENAYKAKMAAYANKKAAYEKDNAAYESASFLMRQFMKVPVDPGVPPVREENTLLKPTLFTEIDAQIKAKEAELLAVNNRRRTSVAQVEADARQLRLQFDNRSSTMRGEADKKRAELLATQAALVTQGAAEEKQINQEFAGAAQKADGIRAELDADRKKAEGYYEAREESIKNTQVFRIATTVEIIRGLLFGKHPISITASAKERGDMYTDQISMVRIWVYPVLAFIVAFLPTLMVEVGFSTIFEPEYQQQQRPVHRLGFLGRRLHWIEARAGRLKLLRAERTASEASAQIAVRDRAVADAQAATQEALAEKEAAVKAAQESIDAAKVELETQVKNKEEEWVAQLGGMADSLNRAIVEKDALRDLQKSEIERQVQMRQNAWSDRITQMRQELDDQRTAAEAERTALMQEHHEKLMEVTEDCKTQVAQARRQMADAELAAVENSAKLANDLKEAANARDEAVARLQQQTESLSLKLSQANEDAAREIEKASRQEKHRSERQQMELTKTLRQHDEDLEHKLKQREHELSLAFEVRLAEEKSKAEQDARRREADVERQLESRVRELDTRWNQEVQQREEAAQIRLKQQEQQLQAQAEMRLSDLQTRAEQQLRDQKVEFERRIEAQLRESDARWREELQQKELAFHSKLKQREQELTNKAAARETELQNQWASDFRARQEEWEHEAGSRVRAVEARFEHEAQQKEALFQSKSRQRDQQWQVKLDAARAEAQTQTELALRRREEEAAGGVRELETRLRKEMQQNDEAAQAKARQREQELTAQLTAQAEAQLAAAQAQWETELEKKTRAAIEPFKVQLAHTEKTRDEALESAYEAVNHVQELERKLTDASSFLNGLKNGKNLVGGRV